MKYLLYLLLVGGCWGQTADPCDLLDAHFVKFGHEPPSARDKSELHAWLECEQRHDEAKGCVVDRKATDEANKAAGFDNVRVSRCEPNAPPKAKKPVLNSDAAKLFHVTYNGKDMLCDKPLGDSTCCFVSEDGKQGGMCREPEAAKTVTPNAVQIPDVGVDCAIQRDGSYHCHSKSGEGWIVRGVGSNADSKTRARKRNTHVATADELLGCCEEDAFAGPQSAWEPIDVPAQRCATLLAYNCHSDSPQMGCADRTRILQHDEQQPPKYWCHKPQP